MVKLLQAQSSRSWEAVHKGPRATYPFWDTLRGLLSPQAAKAPSPFPKPLADVPIQVGHCLLFMQPREIVPEERLARGLRLFE